MYETIPSYRRRWNEINAEGGAPTLPDVLEVMVLWHNAFDAVLLVEDLRQLGIRAEVVKGSDAEPRINFPDQDFWITFDDTFTDYRPEQGESLCRVNFDSGESYNKINDVIMTITAMIVDDFPCPPYVGKGFHAYWTKPDEPGRLITRAWASLGRRAPLRWFDDSQPLAKRAEQLAYLGPEPDWRTT